MSKECVHLVDSQLEAFEDCKFFDVYSYERFNSFLLSKNA